MLHLILGPSGSGKTYWIRQQIAETVKQGRGGLLLLVPEQNNYESERAMLTLLGSASTDVVEVVSFTRLADMTRGGAGAAKDVAPECVRVMVMGRAYRTVKSELRAYSRQGSSPEFFRAVLRLDEELRRSRVTTQALCEASAAVGGSLDVKIRDLSLLISTYRALLGVRFSDPLDDLDRLAERLDEECLFDGETVFVDAFSGFTEQQFAVLERMMSQSEDVYIALCADGLDDPDHGMGLFSNVKRTANRLIRLARERGVRVAAPLVLHEEHRFGGSVIANVERLLRGAEPDAEASGGRVAVFECVNAADEADTVARTIRRMVRCEGYRYRDFAVIARRMEAYQADLIHACERYRVPCFNDRRVRADSLALFRFVLNALNCAIHAYPAESVFSLIKSELSPLSVEEASELESYALLWNKRGRDWVAPWEDNPNGLEKDQDEEGLARILASRDRALLPVEALAAALKKNDPRASCRAVYDLLKALEVDRRLEDYAARLDEEGDSYYADLHRQSWDVMMTALDYAVRALEGETCEPEEFYSLFSILLSASDLGAIPDRLDEVVIGSADRIRTGSPRVVFIIGANYGDFPAAVTTGGLLSPYDRRLLFRDSPDRPDYVREQSVDERFIAYASLTAPSEGLFLTYSTSSLEGDGKMPCEFIEELRRNGETLRGVRFLQSWETADDAFEGVLPAIERVCGERDGLAASLADQLRRRGDRRGDLLEAPLRPAADASVSPDLAKRLFGVDIRMSASRAEQYGKCPFSYFCKYGLKAQPEQNVDFNPLRSGLIVHYVLEEMLRAHGTGLSDLAPEARRREIEEYIRRYAEIYFGGFERLDSDFRYQLERLAVSLDYVLAHIAEELAHTDFCPDRFELPIGGEGEPTLTVPLSEGSVRLNGSVDRVDVYRVDGKTYVRVVDYKSGGKTFRLSDLLSGVNMQMLFYLFAVTDSTLYENAEPAGVLYMPASRSSVRREKFSDAASQQKQMDDVLRMNGLLLDDGDLLDAMERNAAGRFVPRRQRAGGNAVSRSDFDLIRSYILHQIGDLGERLHDGQIGADPLIHGNQPHCAYCDYAAVCRHGGQDGRRTENLKTEETLDRMREEVSADALPSD